MIESPWVWFLVFFEGGGCRLGGFEVSVVAGLDFCRGALVEFGMQALVVEPPHPFQRRELDLLDGSPGSALADQLGLVKRVDRFGESVVIAVADGPR